MALSTHNRSVIGVEIDANSVNLVQSAFSHGKSKITHIVVEKIVFDKDKTKEVAIIEALTRAITRFKIQNTDVVCTLCDQKFIVDHVTLPVMPPEELAQAVKLQASSSQHYPVDQPVYDFELQGRIIDKGVEKNNVRLAVLAKSSLDNFINRFKSPATDLIGQFRKLLQVDSLMGFNITRVVPLSVAIGNIIQNSKNSNVVAVFYMGSSTAELNIYRDMKLESSRKVNVNSADFTKALTGALFSDSGKTELSIVEAENLKKEYGIPTAGDNFLIRGKITANQALSLLRPRVEQLSREISRCFDYYYDRNQIKKIDQIVLMGEAAHLKRLNEVLNAELGIPVVVSNPLEGLDISAEGSAQLSPENIQSLIPALGASLADPILGINLLPAGLRNVEKKFKERILIVLAGLAIVFIALGFCLVLFMQCVITGQQLDKSKKEYQEVVLKIKNLKNKLYLERDIKHRMKTGAFLMNLSHLPSRVSLTQLKMEHGNLELSGMVVSQGGDPKMVVDEMIKAISTNAFYDVKLASMKGDEAKDEFLEFVIKGNYKMEKYTHEDPDKN